MASPNPHRGEVALPFGGGEVILRCSYGALGKLWPLLFDAADEVKANRRMWLARSQEQFGSEPPPVEKMEWQHHLMGAVAATEVDTIAKVIVILAEEHQPHLTYAEVMKESPGWGLLWVTMMEVVRLFHWRPGQQQATEAGTSEGPFAQSWLSLMLSLLRPRTGSSPNGSGA